MGKCKGRSRMERFLEKYIFLSNSGISSNKEHWNSIILDGTIPDTDIKRMIAESYDLICKKK